MNQSTEVLKAKLDYEDYCAIPNDGKRYEIINGELHVTPAPNTPHQRALGRLYTILDEYFQPPSEVFLSPTDVILSPHDVVQPDIVVVADPATVAYRGIEGAPFLAVEIVSPSTSRYDRNTKAKTYEQHGIMHLWLVDPEDRQVQCFQLRDGVYHLVASCGPKGILEHPAFPGLTLASLWK